MRSIVHRWRDNVAQLLQGSEKLYKKVIKQGPISTKLSQSVVKGMGFKMI